MRYRSLSTIVICSGTLRVFAKGRMVHLTPTEFDIFQKLWSKGQARLDQLSYLLYDHRPYCDQPRTNVIPRLITKMRPKLHELGLEIYFWQGCYYLTLDRQLKEAA